MERRIPFNGEQLELDGRLELAARCLGLRIAGSTVSDGSYLASHPDEIPWSAEATLEDGHIVLGGRTLGAPWSRKKRERILKLRLDELGASLAGEAVTRQALAAISPGIRGICSLLVWSAASATVAVVAALIPLLAAGMILANDVVRTLATRANTLERIGALPLPSIAELQAIDGMFLLGVAVVLMLPVAFLVGFFTALVHTLGDLHKSISRLTAIVLLLLWALLLAGLWSAMGPLLGTLFTAATACLTISATGFLWSYRKEVAGRLKLSAAHFTLLPLVVIALIALPLVGNRGSRRDQIGRFRDRFLMPTALGRSVATFYYRHTLYAAETYKPSFSDPFTATRRDPGFLRSALTTEPDMPLLALGIVPEICSPNDARAQIARRRHDFYVLPESAEWRAAVRDANVSDRTVFIEETPDAMDLAALLETKSSEALGFRALTKAGWSALLFGGPLYVLWLILALAGSIGGRFLRAAPVVLVAAQLIPVALVLAISMRNAKVWATQDQEQLALLLSDADPRVRATAASQAARVMARVRERRPELFAALVLAVHDKEIGVRTWAVLALAWYGDDAAIPDLVACLRDDSILVRYRAAAAMRSLNIPAARPHLEERMREDSWYVGMHALAAIRAKDDRKR